MPITYVKKSTHFSAAEKELVDSVDMLARAASVLKRELSFAQGSSKNQLQKKWMKIRINYDIRINNIEKHLNLS